MPELPFKIPGVWAEDNHPPPPLDCSEYTSAGDRIKLGVRGHTTFLARPRLGSKKHLDRLLKYGILRPCQSPWNTPFLPVQKPGTEDFRPVQDFYAINSATVTLHPVVPNLYMLLGLIPAEAKFFTCLDL
jgi:hypothetical protein